MIVAQHNFPSTLVVEGTLRAGIFDGLVGFVQSQPFAFVVLAVGLLVAMVIFVQSLAILAFGLDRLLARLSRPEKKDEATKGRLIRRLLRSLWRKSDD